LDIPIYIADASQLTETGYVGLSPDSIFAGLLKKCKQNMQESKFPVSIVYIDEIDKIAINKNDNKDGVGTKTVQEEFLKIFESTNYFCNGGRFGLDREYDISNVMFIVGGAFSGLEQIIENRLNSNKCKNIGFFNEEFSVQDNLNILQQATADDIINYGFMPEFVGRLPNKVILNSLTKQDLIKILTESQNNVISQYKQVFMEAGIKLEILEETIEYVAEQAIKNRTGARGLKSVLSSILNKILFETASKGQTDFTLSPKDFVF
jgi:ATP-dependent Clp protease ATP-binding subunit ClpX